MNVSMSFTLRALVLMVLGFNTFTSHATETSAELNHSNLAEQCQSLAPFSFLLGNWHHTDPQQIVTETWQQVSENTFEGQGAFIAQGTGANKQSIESLRLVKMLDGVFYIAKPKSNLLPVSFKLIECTENKYVFVNEANDFPQKIIYQLSSKDTLLVDVSTLAGKGFSLTFKRQG